MDTFGTLTTQDQLAFFDRDLLERALPTLFFAGFGQPRNIPKNTGRKVSYRRFNSLTTVTSALSEGVTPAAASLSNAEVIGTAAQYGNYVQVSDFMDMSGIDKVMSESGELISENAGQSVDQIIRAEVVTGTSVGYATGSARTSQDASNPITLAAVKKRVRTLQANNAMPFRGSRSEANGQGGLYVGIIHPYMWHDLTNDTDIKDTMKYSNPEQLWNFELPIAGGVAWYVSTHAPLFAAGGSGGVDVYAALIFGKNAFGVVDVAGSGRFRTIAKPLGSAGAADPLDQRATLGWKAYQLPKVLNNNFFTRFEAGVAA